MNNTLHKKYLDKKDTYMSFGKKMRSLIVDFLQAKNIKYHSVTYRIKDEKSFLNKLELKKDKYKDLNDMTDITGIRIITYYSDTVDEVGNIIEKEFKVDEEKTIDKRKELEPNTFGYLSLHYVVSLENDRLNLVEYSKFKNLKLEIQVRSISQHTWAEIEHDLGYKSAEDIPKDVKRDFSRLAGLLELVDKELIEIRDKLEKHQEDVKKKIKENNKSLIIDYTSLKSYLDFNKDIKILNENICNFAGVELQDSDSKLIRDTIKELKYLGFNTIEDIDTEIKNNKNKIYDLAKNIFDKDMYNICYNQIALLYLCYFELAKEGQEENINKFLIYNNINSPKNFSKKLISAYNHIENLY